MDNERRRENAAVKALMVLPPLAMIRTGEERWTMVMPVEIEMFGYGAKVALGEVFDWETRSA